MHENVAEKYKVTQLLKVGPGEGRGGGDFLIRPIRVCAMCRWTGYVFHGLESSEYTISPLSVLNRVSFWTGSLLECVSPVLNRGTKWAIFVLTRVGVWRSRRHSSTQTSFECPPPRESKEVWWELKRGDCVRVQRVKIYHLAVLALNSFSLCGRCKKETGRGRGQKREREKGVPYQPSLPNPLPFSLSPNTPAYQVETLKFNMTASLRGDKQRKWG